MTTTEQAVSRTLQQYVAATNTGDIEAYKATLAADVVFTPPDHPALRGRDNVGAWVKESFFDPFAATFDAKFDEIAVLDADAFAAGTFTLELEPKTGGESMKTAGAFFNIFREESPGSWKYRYGIWNFDHPLA